MHDIVPVVICLFSVSIGMIVTMAMTWLTSQPARSTVSLDRYERNPTDHMAHGQEGMLVPISSKATGMHGVTSDLGTTDPPQAA